MTIASSLRARTIAMAIIVWSLVPTLACRSAAPPRAGEPCLGKEILAVRNETGETIEVYMVRGGTSQIIGSAGAGRTELDLPPGADRGVYYQTRRARDGQILAGMTARQYGDRLQLQVECLRG